MFNKIETEQKIVALLLQIKAIKLQPTKPFTLSSGLRSPIYCDNRLALSHPVVRTYIRQKLTELIQEEFGSLSCIAGVATSGIPYGVLVAQELGLPFVYVRKKAKDHGTGKVVEGDLHASGRIVVVEDVITTGQSSLGAVKALGRAGCYVAGVSAIFSYGFEEAKVQFEQNKCRFTTLFDYQSLMKHAEEGNYISKDEVHLLRQWCI